MSDETKCPRCGESLIAEQSSELDAFWRCGTRRIGDEVFESVACLRRQLAEIEREHDYIRSVLVMANKNCERRDATIAHLRAAGRQTREQIAAYMLTPEALAMTPRELAAVIRAGKD